MKPVRVLVVDDSALMRKLIPQIMESDDSIQVVGTAMDGNFGLRKIEELNPDVVTLDLEMPGMSGIDMLKAIMRHHPVPVIVVSSHSTEGASVTLKALGLGAFDFVAKPNDVSTRMSEIAHELIAKIKAAAQGKGISVTPLPPALYKRQASKANPRSRGSSDPRCGHRSFDRRTKRSAVCSVAVTGRFSGHDPGGPAHAGRVYRYVCPPSE